MATCEPSPEYLAQCYFDPAYNEYASFTSVFGGKLYFRQNRPGTPWYNAVSNEKGWTVDFNLEVNTVENSDALSNTDEPHGLGVYVNDGSRQEVIEFLQQEIVFKNAKQAIVFDNTVGAQYRLIGKKDSLKLYARLNDAVVWQQLADITFNTPATNEGNGRKPSVYEDSQGNIHTVWHDDGNGSGQIYYAKFSDGAWSKPELVISNPFGAQNADLVVDSNGRVFVVYETRETDYTTVAFIYRNDMGWSAPSYIEPSIFDSKNPKIALDTSENIHIVWQDHRAMRPDIFYIRWDKNTLSFGRAIRVITSGYGAYRPAIGTYFDRAYVAYAERQSDGSQQIKATSYDPANNAWASAVAVGVYVGQNPGNEDWIDIVVGVDGKIFIAWQDDAMSGNYDIYARILNPMLGFYSDIQKVTATTKNCLYPSLGVQKSTGDIYVVWEDSRKEGEDVDPYLDPEYVDPYRIDYGPAIYCAYYDNLQNTWYSSGNWSFDVEIISDRDNRRMFSPCIAPYFSGNMHILYECEMAALSDEYEYLSVNKMFSQIRDAIYDLSRVTKYTLPTEVYLDHDQLVSGVENRKEIRFGHFSNTLSGKYLFGNFRMYLDDAVPPFMLWDISERTFPIGEIRVNDTLVNDYGDMWLATICGMYFYFHVDRNLYKIDDGAVAGHNIRCMCFNRNNVLFAATGSTVLYSFDHKTFHTLSVTVGSDIVSLTVDYSNRLIIGTKANGVYVVEYAENPLVISSPTNNDVNPNIAAIVFGTGTIIDNFATGAYVSAVKVDENNVIWAATRDGLYRYLRGNVTRFSTANGLSTNWLNDLSVRNTAIRYVATANGLFKMVGTSFEHITAERGQLWSNNVKSVVWQEPNVLWVGTLSSINQVHELLDGTYASTFYSSADYSAFKDALDDLQTYFIIVDEDVTIKEDAQVEVYLNGNRILHGFTVSLSNANVKAIRFETPLFENDVVNVVVRNDIVVLSSFGQTEDERRKIGSQVIRVKDLKVDNGTIYAITGGDTNEVKINDQGTPIPYDVVHLDATPPTGCIEIVEQIDTSTVRVSIKDATDGVNGSGVDKMVISNFPNFTTDGATLQTPVPFSTSAVHNLLSSQSSNGKSLSFTSGTGSVLKYFTEANEIYAATSNPAAVYKMNNSTGTWSQILAFGPDEYVDFIARFNAKFIISVGHDTNAAKIYIYADNNTFTNPTIRNINGTRAYAAQELLNTLYIAGNDGRVYGCDGSDLTTAFSGLSSNVYALAATASNLLAGTGESGRVYRLDPSTGLAVISHQDTDIEITAMACVSEQIYAGTLSEGKILRTNALEDAFNLSFKTVASRVNALRVFNNTVYAAIGKTVYSLSNNTWQWRAGDTEDIKDVTLTSDGSLFYLTETGVVGISSASEYFTVYLKLIDRAGNVSQLYDDNGQLIACRATSIEIGDLQSFVTENRILELDDVGNVVSSIVGIDKFYSADKIVKEQGIYFSQIFDGTNDLIKWDRATWTADEPVDTEVLMYFRTSNSQTDILTKEWMGPYTRADSNDLDISFLNGQFLQFRAVLLSEAKDISPSLSRIVINGVTSESIHFFTTNFVLPSRISRGIITSQKILPVAADVVFGVNTTDSVNWADYQIVDENRLFSVVKGGNNLRVGIKLLSPSRSIIQPATYAEYGPYGSSLFVNNVNFDYTNPSATAKFDFRVTFYSDLEMTDQVYQASTVDKWTTFSADGDIFPEGGKTISNATSTAIIFALPNDANIQCDSYYYVKVEAHNQTTDDWTTISNDHTFTVGCSPSFVDTINFSYENTSGSTKHYQFRVRFYRDGERTDLYRTEYSGNNRTGWIANSVVIPEGGVAVNNGAIVDVSFTPDLSNFETNTIYYLVIEAYDVDVGGPNFLLVSNSYTFEGTDANSLIYCGPYQDVPVVKNFGLMFELVNNEFVTLNLR